MNLKDASSCLFEFHKLDKLLTLIDRRIFYLEYTSIYMFKITDIKITKINKSEVMITLICSPLDYKHYRLYHDDIELNLEDLHKKWFYDESGAIKAKINYARGRQYGLPI